VERGSGRVSKLEIRAFRERPLPLDALINWGACGRVTERLFDSQHAIEVSRTEDHHTWHRGASSSIARLPGRRAAPDAAQLSSIRGIASLEVLNILVLKL
jgi:hypothetical protein